MPDDDLHARLVAALRARLEVARAATDGPWAASTEVRLDDVDWVIFNETDTIARFYSEQNAAHAIAVDPATEIRRVEALLRVVERHVPGTNWPLKAPAAVLWCWHCKGPSPCELVRDLAAGEGIEDA